MGHIMKIYSEDLPKMGYKFSYTNAATNQKSLNPHALARRATLIIVLGESTTNREKGTLDPGSIKELQKFPLYALLNTVLAPERGPVVLWIGDWSDQAVHSQQGWGFGGGYKIAQTLEGSFSAVSTPNFVTEASVFRAFFDSYKIDMLLHRNIWNYLEVMNTENDDFGEGTKCSHGSNK